MSSAVKKFEGVSVSDLEAGKRPFSLTYDPAKCELSKIIDAIKAGGETVAKMD